MLMMGRGEGHDKTLLIGDLLSGNRRVILPRGVWRVVPHQPLPEPHSPGWRGQPLGPVISRKVPIRNPCKGSGWASTPLTIQISLSSGSLSMHGRHWISTRTGFLISPFLQHPLVWVITSQKQVQSFLDTCAKGREGRWLSFKLSHTFPTSEAPQEGLHINSIINIY